MKKIIMQNKVVVITGASSGIGKALAEQYASKKYKLVLAARNSEKLKKIQEDLSGEDQNILIVETDVSKESDCQVLIEKAIEKFNRIDILINNAGISMRSLFEEVDLDVIRRLMDTNFWGAVYCTKFALPHILLSRGSVVGVSSIAGYKGLPGRVGYSSSKFALQGFLEVLRIENLKKG